MLHFAAVSLSAVKTSKEHLLYNRTNVLFANALFFPGYAEGAMFAKGEGSLCSNENYG